MQKAAFLREELQRLNEGPQKVSIRADPKSCKVVVVFDSDHIIWNVNIRIEPGRVTYEIEILQNLKVSKR